MIAITSISPSHANFQSQFDAINSWIEAGYKVVSLNSKEEIEALKGFVEVDFVETSRTNEVLFKKPYVLISAIIDYAKELDEECVLIINSDVIIKDSGNQAEYLKSISKEGIVIINRYDFENDLSEGKKYEQGFDGFFINKKWLHIFPQSVLCMGQCFWDFWIPYQSILSKVPVFKIQEPYLYHRSHGAQYSTENWLATGEIFRGEVSCREKKIAGFRDVSRMSSYVFQKIIESIKK
jgi:hypothetical protein